MSEPEVVEQVARPMRRRHHSREFKAEVIRAATQPNVSIASVAMHYRLNANLLRTWITNWTDPIEPLEPEEPTNAPSAMPQAEFVPLQLGVPEPTSSATEIKIEVRRGAEIISVRWPVSAAKECATWLHGWLR